MLYEQEIVEIIIGSKTSFLQKDGYVHGLRHQPIERLPVPHQLLSDVLIYAFFPQFVAS